MLPLGHVALAYLLYVGYAASNNRPIPAGWTLLPLVIGCLLPDLIDKPLAYSELLTHGRSLAHSAVALVVVGVLVWVAARRWTVRRKSTWLGRFRNVSPAAFVVGYGSHLIGDAYEPMLAGRYADARFLLYPLYSLPEVPADEIAPWIRLLRVYRNMETHPQIELILVAVVVFVGLRIRTYAMGKRSGDIEH